MFFDEDTIVDVFLDQFSHYYVKRFSFLEGVVDKLSSHPIMKGHDWAVVGGAVRDIFFGHQPKDIDILVNGPKESLHAFVDSYLAPFCRVTKNSFGGIKAHGESLELDMWTIDSMWAVQKGYLSENGFQTYLECATYNIDTAFVLPDKREGEVEKMRVGFEDGLLTLNSKLAPHKKIAATRAYRLSHKYNLKVDASVRDWVREIQGEGS